MNGDNNMNFNLIQQNPNINQIENQYPNPYQFYNEFNNNPSTDNLNNNNNYMKEQIIIPDIDELICQKQFIDDDYLLQLHQRLAQTRELRKISENGVKILNGRVRCLKEENQKTLAKINLTSKKTNDKLLTLERKRSQSKERMKRAKCLEKELYKLKEKNNNKKMERDNGLINSRKRVISENKIKGKISKKEKKEIDNIKIMNELNDKNMKKNKIEVIRSQVVQKNQKRKMMEIEKKEVIIKDLEEKINYEINKKKELEKEINKMLQDESETLKRINQTNEMQKKIFEDFEKILSWDGNEFIYNNEKYLINDENNIIDNDNEIIDNNNFEEKKDI